MNHILAVFLISVDDNLSIGICLKNMAPFYKFCSYFLKVIYFSVKGKHQIACFVIYRLASTFQIDDGKSSEAYGSTLPYEHAFAVRASVTDSIHHCL